MTRRTCNLLHRTISGYRLLDDGETVLVGVSGGADSLCLLSLLASYNEQRRRNWRIIAAHVSPGFPGWNTDRLERLFRRLGVEYRLLTTSVADREHRTENICRICTQARRRALFELARGSGIRRIALAHHLEDVNETYLLNLLFTASASAFVPKQDFFGGRVQIIRPLYRFSKPLIRRHLAAVGLHPVRNRCPQVRTGQRLLLRRFLSGLARRYPRVPMNLFAGIHNLKPDYLPGALEEEVPS